MWLVISDSHDNIKTLSRAIEIANEREIQHLFHCGDIIAPFSAKIVKGFKGKLHAVFGNNDGEKFGLKKILGDNLSSSPMALRVNNYNILMMHEPFNFRDLKGYDYVFYGHTHELDIRHENETTIINPGDSSGWVSGKPTCVIVEPGKTENIIEL
ncbi:MAG: metallophosphoesterase [Kosmotogaceae bacterium]